MTGTGAPGYSGDNGSATSAQLDHPYGVAIDAAGALYISDSHNNVIRKVSGGVITTVVSGITLPRGIAFDTAGNLYIASLDHRVREVALPGWITTVAGTGAPGYNGDNRPAAGAQLNNPPDVAVDAAGNLYIADRQNNRVRLVTGGVIVTLAGTGFPAYGGDNGLPNIAQLMGPSGIALDNAGSFYIADTFNNRVRKVSNNVITTVAGNGVPSYSGDNGPSINAAINSPLGLAVDALGRIFFADSGNNRIRVLTPLCSFVLTSSIKVPGSGGAFTFSVQTTESCPWTVTGLPDWITLGSASSASGPGNVMLTVAENSGAPRSALITVAGISVTISQDACTYAISPGGQAFTAVGGTGVVTVSAPIGCGWSVVNSIPFVFINGGASGVGNGSITYQVATNVGPDRSSSMAVGGTYFTIEQQAATIPGLNFIGSMPHIAAEENWITTFTFVNHAAVSTQARLNLLRENGSPLPLLIFFPLQNTPGGLLTGSSFDRTLASNASLVINTYPGFPGSPVEVGSAQLAATGSIDGFAIFHLIPGAQEAVVPLETRNASSYLLAFDNTGDVVLGVAVENVSAQAGDISLVIRDDTGALISVPGATISLAGNGHTSFVLSQQYPVTGNKRGTIEFDTPAGGRISVLGIRTTPIGTECRVSPCPNSTTLTTIPALANVGTSGGSIAHLATGNGWQTTFVLVNTGTNAALAHLKFFADGTGAPLSLPISFPQVSANITMASAVDQTLAPGATLLVQSTGTLTDTLLTGSAQLTTAGSVGGFVIFRYNPNGQEAVVPLESRNAGAYLLAFDNTIDTATGIAINSVSTQAVNIPVVVRDATGTQIATDTIALAANGHLAFTLVTDKYPATANIRGTIEFDAPPGSQIGALGIRISVAHTFTTLPALAK